MQQFNKGDKVIITGHLTPYLNGAIGIVINSYKGINSTIYNISIDNINIGTINLPLDEKYLMAFIENEENLVEENMPIFYRINDKKYGKKTAVIITKNKKPYCFIEVMDKKDKSPSIKLRAVSDYQKIEKIPGPPEWLKVKIKSCDKSADLFPGNRKLRAGFVGKVIEVYEYLPQYICRIDDVARDCYVITDEESGKKFKFLKEEIEFLYPNPKGYKFKKDKTIKVSSLVKCVNNKEFRKCGKVGINKKEIFTVEGLTKNEMCPQRSVLVLKDSHGNIHKGYIQYFKVI